ncbi:MAG: outer membrane lipid asymmetry maintenance protein MlaD [Rickettsiaceae bacterium]|nr:MAG: outer membrane lipid asymmetry maintenance protein MlaD [Rickettsiaceae bacterium]
MKYNILETTVGFAVIAIAILFLTFAYKSGYPNQMKESYLVRARFQSIEGISEGTDVMTAGIKIGTVQKLTLDEDNFTAILNLALNKDVKLPKDSKFIIATSGILGGKHIAVNPGGDEENLTQNDITTNTQSSVNLEELISKLMYSLTNK